LNELLEIIYLIQQRKNIGSIDTNLTISESEQEVIDSIGSNINTSTLVIFWQLILKVLDELAIVSNPILSLEMLIVRLVHIKDMPSYEKVLESLKSTNLNETVEDSHQTLDVNKGKKFSEIEKEEMPKISKDQIINTTQTKPILSSIKEKSSEKKLKVENITSFEDLIRLASEKKELSLKYDLEKNVNLIKFSQGKIDISFNQNLEKNFVRNLTNFLLELTERRWVITLSKKEGQKSFLEMKDIKKKKELDEEKNKKIYKKFKDIFSDGELLEVKKED